MTTLIIARHGNTFTADETPRRVGARTDLPLVDTGRQQAQKLGAWLKENGCDPDITYCSELMRTQETAQLALKEAGYLQPVFPLKIFNEIDYGPDENLTEDKVKARLGEQSLKDWDEKAIVPDGWQFDPSACITHWKDFAAHIVAEGYDCVLVVTSNGVARFAPHLAGNFVSFAKENKIKLSTGALGILGSSPDGWTVKQWNIRP
jgi:probable phosphoglycerate mutase